MEGTVLDRLPNIKLNDEEDGGFNLSEEDISTSMAECKRSLIGKVFGEKVTNFFCLKNTLTLLRSTIGPVKIKVLGINLYQLVFTRHSDKMRILHGKVWTFDS